MVTLAESGGANLNYAAEIFVEGARSFANQARMSAMGLAADHRGARLGHRGRRVPTGTVGLRGWWCAAKPSCFWPGRRCSRPLLGEVATDEELGGAEMHAQTAGTAEYLAENDADGVRIVREIVSLLPWNDHLPPAPTRAYAEPLYPIDDLLGLIPDDPKKPLRRARNPRRSGRRLSLS